MNIIYMSVVLSCNTSSTVAGVWVEEVRAIQNVNIYFKTVFTIKCNNQTTKSGKLYIKLYKKKH